LAKENRKRKNKDQTKIDDLNKKKQVLETQIQDFTDKIKAQDTIITDKQKRFINIEKESEILEKNKNNQYSRQSDVDILNEHKKLLEELRTATFKGDHNNA
jgi:hypothetical protein